MLIPLQDYRMLAKCLLPLALLVGFYSQLEFCSSASAQEPTPPKKFIYKKTKEAELALYAYLPKGWEAEKKYPAIVFFFGGGWTNGKVEQFESQSRHLASRGMVAICADYRVKSRHGVKPDACVEDAKSAIRWVRQNAGMLGVDPNKIVGAGGSAGGHLAACTGVCPGLDAAGEDQKISSKPNVLVLYNPVLNFNVTNLTDRIGGNAQLAKAISPTQQLTADGPPSLLFYGKEDKLMAQGEEFQQAAKKLGNRCEMILVDGVGHGFFNRPPHQEATTERVDQFLVSLGYLSPVVPAPAAGK
jgi:acetyl esterase